MEFASGRSAAALRRAMRVVLCVGFGLVGVVNAQVTTPPGSSDPGGAKPLPTAVDDSPPPPVVIERDDDGTVRYSIRDIKTPAWRGRRLGFGRAIEFFRRVLDAPSFTVDPKKGSATFHRSEPLADLEERIDRCSKGNGFMPFWEELVARTADPEKWPDPPAMKRVLESELQGTSPSFVSLTPRPRGSKGQVSYLLSVRTEGLSAGRMRPQIHEYVLRIDEGEVECRHSYSRPDLSGSTPLPVERAEWFRLDLGPREKLSFRVNRLIPHCDGGTMFALRAYRGPEPVGTPVWRNGLDLFGSYQFLAVDLEGDGRQELVVFRTAHEKSTVLIYRWVAPQPASPESPKSGGPAPGADRNG
ncbi:MAG: hypothetical protein AAF488_06115 [Planctomycetota bacterium]